MHKFPIPVAHAARAANPRWSPLRTGALLLLGLLLAPLIAEGALLCHAQWSQVLGRNTEARTPVLNSLHDGLEAGHQSVWGFISSYFKRVPWSHEIVLATGAVVVVVGMLMLKL
jgi:hypothetical protein